MGKPSNGQGLGPVYVYLPGHAGRIAKMMDSHIPTLGPGLANGRAIRPACLHCPWPCPDKVATPICCHESWRPRAAGKPPPASVHCIDTETRKTPSMFGIRTEARGLGGLRIGVHFSGPCGSSAVSQRNRAAGTTTRHEMKCRAKASRESAGSALYEVIN